MSKKVVCFGTGIVGVKFAQNVPLNISYYVDNDPKKWNQEFINSSIYKPEELLQEEKGNIAIIVASMFYSQISEQLTKMGFLENEHFWNGYELFYSIIFSGGQEIILDYPVNSVPRYGYGKPPHQKLYQIINLHRDKYRKHLKSFTMLKEYLEQIPMKQESYGTEPFWLNGSMPALDAISIYGFLQQNNPNHFLEVGSGNSTKFARRAVQNHHLKTKITSIDPEPRAEIDIICDTIIREPLENIDLSIFQQLKAGDILFIDNSHRSFMNSDVTVVFLDILPYLKEGVIVGFHDIFLPYDYLPDWANRYYSEQYLLASYILAEGTRFEIELPNMFISCESELFMELNLFYDDSPLKEIVGGGGAFWIRMR